MSIIQVHIAGPRMVPAVSQRLATHSFSSIEDAPFDVREYSRLKFGSDRVAKDFGYQMANHYYKEIGVDGPTVVIPAPSTTVPVAATMLSRHFMNRLNAKLAHDHQMPVEWTMVHRNMTYNNNYADLPKEERKKLLAADTIYINRDFIEGKKLIFVDDCTITGTHEEKIMTFLEDEGLSNDHCFMCFAKYEGDDASIEMRLNHTEVRDAQCLVRLAWEINHSVTTRSLRLLLEYQGDFDALMATAPERFLEDSYHCAIVKGYNRHDPYLANFNKLASKFRRGVEFTIV